MFRSNSSFTWCKCYRSFLSCTLYFGSSCICSTWCHWNNCWSITCFYFYSIWTSCLYCCWFYFPFESFISWSECHFSSFYINCILTNYFLSILLISWSCSSFNFYSVFYKFIAIWLNWNSFFYSIYYFSMRCKCRSSCLFCTLNISCFCWCCFQFCWNDDRSICCFRCNFSNIVIIICYCYRCFYCDFRYFICIVWFWRKDYFPISINCESSFST